MIFIYSSLKNIYDEFYGNFIVISGIAENINNFREFKNLELPFIKSIISRVKSTLYASYVSDVIPTLDPSRNKIYKSENELSTNLSKYIEWATVNFLREINPNSISNDLDDYKIIINKVIYPVLNYLKVANYIKDKNINFNFLSLTLNEANKQLEQIQEEQYLSQKGSDFDKTNLNKTIISSFNIDEEDVEKYEEQHPDDEEIDIDNVVGFFEIEQLSNVDTLMQYGRSHETDWCVFNNESQCRSYLSGGRSLYLFYRNQEPYIMYTPTRGEFKYTDDNETEDEVKQFLLEKFFYGFVDNDNFNIETTCDLCADQQLNELTEKTKILPEGYTNGIFLLDVNKLKNKFRVYLEDGSQKVNINELSDFIIETISNLNKTDIGKQIVFKLIIQNNGVSKMDEIISYINNHSGKSSNRLAEINSSFLKKSLVSNDPMINAVAFIQSVSNGLNPEEMISNINLRDYIIRNISKSCPAIEYFLNNLNSKAASYYLSGNKDIGFLETYPYPLLSALSINKKRFIRFLDTYIPTDLVPTSLLEVIIEEKVIPNLPYYIKYISNMKMNKSLFFNKFKKVITSEHISQEQSKILINQCLNAQEFIESFLNSIQTKHDFILLMLKTIKINILERNDPFFNKLSKLIPSDFFSIEIDKKHSAYGEELETYRNLLLRIYNVICENNLLDINAEDNAEIRTFKQLSYLLSKSYFQESNKEPPYSIKALLPNSNMENLISILSFGSNYTERTGSFILNPIIDLLKYHPLKLYECLKNVRTISAEEIVKEKPEILTILLNSQHNLEEVSDLASSSPGTIESLHSQCQTVTFLQKLVPHNSPQEIYKEITNRLSRILRQLKNLTMDTVYEYNNDDVEDDGGYFDYDNLRDSVNNVLSDTLTQFIKIMTKADQQTILENYDVIESVLENYDFDEELYREDTITDCRPEDMFMNNAKLTKIILDKEKESKNDEILRSIIRFSTKEYIDGDIVKIVNNIFNAQMVDSQEQIQKILSIIHEELGEEAIEEILSYLESRNSIRTRHLKETLNLSTENFYKSEEVANDKKLRINSIIAHTIKTILPESFNSYYDVENTIIEQTNEIPQQGSPNSSVYDLIEILSKNSRDLKLKIAYLTNFFHMKNNNEDTFEQLYLLAINSLKNLNTSYGTITKIFEYVNSLDPELKDNLSNLAKNNKIRDLSTLKYFSNDVPLLRNNYYFNIVSYMLFANIYSEQIFPDILENLSTIKSMDETLFNKYGNDINIFTPPSSISPSASLKNILRFYSDF